MIAFIDAHRHRVSGALRWGIEPICAVLQIAPSTYHAAKKRPLSAQAVRDAELRPQVLRVWEQNLSVYGADKVWDQLNKDGVRVARCTIERLMADMGLQGCRRGRLWVRTTEGDDRLDRPADLVSRQFRAPAPNRLWVADLERHEAFLNPAVVKGHRSLFIAERVSLPSVVAQPRRCCDRSGRGSPTLSACSGAALLQQSGWRGLLR